MHRRKELTPDDTAVRCVGGRREFNMTDKELYRLVAGFTKGFLGKENSESKCFMICWPLQTYLSFCGVKTELISGEVSSDKHLWGHYWLKLMDGRIIDPTCDQFNIDGGVKMPKIFIGEKPDYYRINEINIVE